MNNEIAQELTDVRERKLLNASHAQINSAVHAAFESLSPGTLYGLQGVDSEMDGVTHNMWTQATMAAASAGSLVFPQFGDGPITVDADPATYDDVVKVIAGRVARGIIHLHGLADSSGDDWYTL